MPSSVRQFSWRPDRAFFSGIVIRKGLLAANAPCPHSPTYPGEWRAGGSFPISGTTTQFVWNGDNMVAELNSGGTVQALYRYGINLISSTVSGMTKYYLYNAHGDVVQLADSTGAVVKTYHYDAFGNEVSPDAADTNPFRYCGQSNPNMLGCDKDTGLI